MRLKIVVRVQQNNALLAPNTESGILCQHLTNGYYYYRCYYHYCSLLLSYQFIIGVGLYEVQTGDSFTFKLLCLQICSVLTPFSTPEDDTSDKLCVLFSYFRIPDNHLNFRI